MPKIRLEDQEPITLDEETKAAVEAGLASIERGELIPAEQVEKNVRNRYKKWLKTQKEAQAA